jgi:mono/diheme cytochrome c family protein
MKSNYVLLCAMAGVFFVGAGLFAADVTSTNENVTSPPVFVPDTSHANDPLPDGVLAWNSLMQETNAAADQAEAHFVFNFTNVSSGNVVILDAHGSCSCTTTELPSKPWIIPPGTNGQIGATVNLSGKSGMQFKLVTVTTDHGKKDLSLRINILPPVIPTLTDAERARGVEMAKADRQAVFKGDCASCHVPKIEGKYGQTLYDAVCAICHEGEHRAAMVPDLHNLKVPTNDEFWRTWIAHGKPGSLMPAFSTAEGGPLNDTQVGTIASYLNFAIPSHVVTLITTNAPPPK